jgi:lipopolysaccharide biosynthesis protein
MTGLKKAIGEVALGIWHAVNKPAKKRHKKERRDAKCESQIFEYVDKNWYQAQYPESRSSKISSALHYVKSGAIKGHNPNPYFSTSWYFEKRPYLRTKGSNPLAHYLENWSKGAVRPWPEFDPVWYKSYYPDVAQSGVEPFLHYLRKGAAEGRRTNGDKNAGNVNAARVRILKMPGSCRHVALLVSYAPFGKIKPHILHYASALRRQAFGVVLILATEMIDDIDASSLINDVDGLIVRANEGFDFAAWAHVINFLDLESTESLLLTNDSIIGPLDNKAFGTMMHRAHQSKADLIALTNNFEIAEHVQSYFLLAKNQGIEALEDYLFTVKTCSSKEEVIRTYEVPLLTAMRGLAVDVLFPVNGTANQTVFGWQGLLERGFPFVKASALALDKNQDWGEVVRQYDYPIETIQSVVSMATTTAVAKAIHKTNRVTIDVAEDAAISVPSGIAALCPTNPGKIAVVCHIFHTELAVEVLAAINNIPFACDLYVTTTDGNKKADLERVFGAWAQGKIEIRIVANRGRDIAPKLVSCVDIYSSYEYCLHIHSKESAHNANLRHWREYLFSTLVGSPDIVRTILSSFHHSPDLGMLSCQHYPPMRQWVEWGGNFERAKQLANRMGANIAEEFAHDFPSGSMFWARCSALRPMLQLGLETSDFEPEMGQIDGTLAHALERLFFVSVEAAGLMWAKIGCSDFFESPYKLTSVMNETDLSVFMAANSWKISETNRPPGVTKERLIYDTPDALLERAKNQSLGINAKREKQPLAVGIVSYNNSREQLEKCLRSVSEADIVYLWDNGDRSEFESEFAPVQLGMQGNLGFGAAHNRMMQRAFKDGAEIYFCINPDGYLLPGALQNSMAMVQSRLGCALVELTQTPVAHPKLVDRTSLRTTWASGAALAIPRRVYEATKGFDERFFMYCEDVDLSWRARAMGFEVVCCPNALFFHETENRKVSAETRGMIAESGAYLARKWGSRPFERWALKQAVGARSPANVVPVRLEWQAFADFAHKFSFAVVR